MEKTKLDGEGGRERERAKEEVKQDIQASPSCFQRAHHRMLTMELFTMQSFSLEGLAR